MTPEEQADYRRRIDRLIAWQIERVDWQPKPTTDRPDNYWDQLDALEQLTIELKEADDGEHVTEH